MRTFGIDLAADPKKTGVAWIEWVDGGARVTDVRVGAHDDELVKGMAAADKSGIDCPLGWPREFVNFIQRHQDGSVEIEPDTAAEEWRRTLCYRVTDIYVKQQVPTIQGLSVSTDRIGVTTMRCAAILAQLAAIEKTVKRDGSGPVVEVYPAASLARWGFSHRGYKGTRGAEGRARLVDRLQEQTSSWLDFGGHDTICRRSDDALDAVLASLTARAAARQLVDQIPEEAQGAQSSADAEGWIALPRAGSDLGGLV